MHLPCDRPHPYLITRDRAAIAYAEADYDIGRSGGCGLATGILAIVDIVEDGFTAPIAAFASSTDIVNVVFLLFWGVGNHRLPFRFHNLGSEKD